MPASDRRRGSAARIDISPAAAHPMGSQGVCGFDRLAALQTRRCPYCLRAPANSDARMRPQRRQSGLQASLNRLRVSTTRTNHASKSLAGQRFSSDGHPGPSRQLAVGIGGDTAEPALGGGGYILDFGEPRGGADHKPIISQGWLGSFEGFRAKSWYKVPNLIEPDRFWMVGT